MKTRLFFLTLAFAILASCTQAVPETPVVPQAPEAPVPCHKEIHAVLDGGTRTSLSMNDAGTHADVLWNAGDEIVVMASDGTDLYANYFTASTGGSTEADFTCDDYISYFADDHAILACYPSSQFIGIDKEEGDEFALPLSVPPVQPAVKGNVGDGLNVAIAYSDNEPGDVTLHFKNVLSLVHFTLDGPGASSVAKAVLQTSYISAGDAVIFVGPGGIGTVDTRYAFANNYGPSWSVALEGTFERGGDYYFAVIPGVSDGFSITFVDGSGQFILKSTDITLNAGRSRIIELGTITIDNSFSSTMPGVERYMTHTQGAKPVDIVVLGEAFTASQQDLFTNLAHAVVDKLFDTPPYSTYKDRFNVYIMSAVSNQSGASVTDGKGNISEAHDTYFKSQWGAESYDDMTADFDKVYSFVESRCNDVIEGAVSIQDVTVLLIINDSRYGGRCSMFSNGQAVAMVPYTFDGAEIAWGFSANMPVSDSDPTAGVRAFTDADRQEFGTFTGDWRNTAIHEFGGHAFGRFSDEYWYTSYNTNPTISEQSWPVPAGLNISGTYDNVPWQTLLDNRDALIQRDPNYGRIGVFQGAGTYILYRWRSEKISCMIDNRDYFSAWQRYLIVKRIMELSGDTFNFQSFLDNDVTTDPVRDSPLLNVPASGMQDTINPNGLVTPVRYCPPLAPPAMIERR